MRAATDKLTSARPQARNVTAPTVPYALHGHRCHKQDPALALCFQMEDRIGGAPPLREQKRDQGLTIDGTRTVTCSSQSTHIYWRIRGLTSSQGKIENSLI